MAGPELRVKCVLKVYLTLDRNVESGEFCIFRRDLGSLIRNTIYSAAA
jgi:hypothetical protein